MRIIIKATNFSLTPSLSEFIDKKIGGEINTLLTRNNGYAKVVKGKDTIEAKVEVARTSRHHNKGNIFRAEVTIRMPGKKTLRAEAEEWDVRVAIDKVRDELFMEISKWKQKKLTGVRKGGRTFKNKLKGNS